MKLKSEFRKKLLAAFLGISICLPLNAAHANTLSYTIQGIETRFQREGDKFTKTDGIDLSKEFFIGLDWGSTELNHISLYHTPVTYTNKNGCLFKAGKLYAMTNAYRFGYTASKNQVMDIGYAQAILAGYADFSETQLAKMQEMIILGNQTMESGFYITDNFAVNDPEADFQPSSNDVVENNLPTSDDTFITSGNSLVDGAAFSGNDTVIQDLIISSDNFMSNLQVDDNVAAGVGQATGDKTVSNVGNDKNLVKKPTMRERISRILQETRLDVFLDSDNEEKAIVENQENNTENDVFLGNDDNSDENNNSEEINDVNDIIEEARRVREQLALLIK